MIQRIQTVYLFLIVVLQSIMLWINNIASNLVDGESVPLKFSDNATLALLVALTAMIPAISLFLYKKRTLQMRFNIFNSILLVVVQGYILYYLITWLSKDDLFISVNPTSFFPVVSLILSILAIKKIFMDELLVKSLNRLRK